VDNNSYECDPELFKIAFPEIKLVRSSKNTGFAGGNNLGIQRASGDCILLLNSDTILRNNAIFLSFQALSQLQGCVALSCKLLYEDGRVQAVAGRFPSLRRELRDLLRLNENLSQQERADVYLGTEFNYETEKEVDWIWGAFFMFKPEILNHFPERLLPSDYFMYMEDVLWCYRIKRLGYKIYFHPAGEVYHQIAGSSSGDNTKSFLRYKQKILPNEYDFIERTKGWVYVKTYYFIKALMYLSLFTREDLEKSKAYLLLVLK
jgi:hypothetical protein